MTIKVNLYIKTIQTKNDMIYSLQLFVCSRSGNIRGFLTAYIKIINMLVRTFLYIHCFLQIIQYVLQSLVSDLNTLVS